MRTLYEVTANGTTVYNGDDETRANQTRTNWRTRGYTVELLTVEVPDIIDAKATNVTTKKLPTIKPRDVECYIGQYVRAHGKNPSGRGLWAFFFPGDTTPWFTPGAILFTEARRLAKEEAARRGQYRCVVGS